MRLFLLICFSCLITIKKDSYAQSNAFTQRIKSIQAVDVPVCIEFTDQERESLDLLLSGKKKIANNPALLAPSFVAQYLYGNAPIIEYQSISEKKIYLKDSLRNYVKRNSFYLLAKLQTGNTNYLVLILERIGDKGAEKILYCFSKSGKLIDKLSLSHYVQSGYAVTISGEKAYFYDEKHACMDKDWVLTIESPQSQPGKYRIVPTGKIGLAR